MTQSGSDEAWRRARRWLAVTVWLVYALTATGTLTVDPETRFTVAEHFVRHGTFAMPEPGMHTLEHEGRHYSVFFPGQSILFLPIAAVGVLLSDVLGVNPALAGHFARFLAATFVIPAFAPIAMLGHLALLRVLGVRPRVALVSGLLLVFGTPLWFLATNSSEEPALAAFGVWAFWALMDARRIVRGGAAAASGPEVHSIAARLVDRLGLAALLLAFGLLHRSTFVSVIAGAAIVALPLLAVHFRLLGRVPARLAVWAVVVALVLSVVPVYNCIRFGNPFDTGYARYYEDLGGLFSNPLLVGLRGHLFSPGKSIFIYAPWLVLLPLSYCFAVVRRRMGPFTWALLVTVAIHLTIYSLYTYWSGAFGWAVRFHVSPLPLLLVPIAVWTDGLRPTGLRRAALGALAALSCVIQLASNALNDALEFRQHPEDYTGKFRMLPDAAAWTWRGSPLLLRFRNIAWKLEGRPLLDIEEDDPQQILLVWNVFPTRAAVALANRKVVAALWGLWIVLLLLAGSCAWRTALHWRRLPRDAPG